MPLTREFHAGRGAISLAFTMRNLIQVVCAPLVGGLVDRYGAKRVLLPGLALFALTLISAQLIGSNLWQLYCFYLLLAPITVMTTPIPYSSVISRWFDRQRGLALGLMMLGMGLGTVVMPPLMQRLITDFGWRFAFGAVGLMILLIPIPFIAILLKEHPADKGQLPDGEQVSAGGIFPAPLDPGMAWPEIWRTRTFWMLISAFALAGASVHACVLHLPALLSDRGLTLQQAAMGSSIVGVAVIVGRLASGYLQDHIFAPHVAFGIFAMSATGIGLLRFENGATVGMISAFLVGLGMGAEVDMIAFLVSRYFGLRVFGTVFGFAFGSFVLAGGIGGALMGAGFDHSGSYQLPLTGFLPAILIAVIIFLCLGPYRYGVLHERCHAAGATR